MKIHYASFAALAGVLISYGCSSTVASNDSEGEGGGTTSSTASTTASTTVASVASSAASTSASTGAGGFVPTCTPTNGTVLGMTNILYGDTDPNGGQDTVNGWKQYGFNIDGKVSTAQSVDLCQPAAGATPATVYPDGNNGIDNAFGAIILPILLGFNATFSQDANDAIAQGTFTLMIDLDGLAAGADQAPLVGKLYTGTALGKVPKFDGTDCWPVAPEGLTNPSDITSSNADFSMGVLATNHWDSTGSIPALSVKASINNVPVDLVIHDAHISMDLAADHMSATNGQIGGVLNTTEFMAEVKNVVGNLDPALCMGSLADSLLKEVQQASDILADGTQDPAKTCDGISIGLGFKAKVVQFGGVGPASAPPSNPCGN